MQTIKFRRPHKEARRAAYPDIGDQLDAIMKMAESLSLKGAKLPQETMDWIERCKAVKTKHPK